MKKHLVRLTIAIGLIASVWAFAVAQNMTHLKTPGIDLAALMLAAVALGLSLPLLVGLSFFASRRRLREAWRQADASTRGLVILYLGADAVAAAISWTVFALLLLRR
jgi:hypothetical protein